MLPAAITTSRRALAVCVVGLLGLLSAFGGMQRAVAATTTSTITCPALWTTPFAPWKDMNSYWPAKNGGFEQTLGSDWSLGGGASVVSGNESFYVKSTSDSHSLSIPPGGSATFTPACVSTNSPTMRLFAKGGSTTSPLTISATVATASGNAKVLLGSVPASTLWAPTPVIPLYQSLTGATLTNGYLTLQLHFTNNGSSSWQIDDVYVDPFKLK
jgi:hypothetical protein